MTIDDLMLEDNAGSWHPHLQIVRVNDNATYVKKHQRIEGISLLQTSSRNFLKEANAMNCKCKFTKVTEEIKEEAVPESTNKEETPKSFIETDSLDTKKQLAKATDLLTELLENSHQKPVIMAQVPVSQNLYQNYQQPNYNQAYQNPNFIQQNSQQNYMQPAYNQNYNMPNNFYNQPTNFVNQPVYPNQPVNYNQPPSYVSQQTNFVQYPNAQDENLKEIAELSDVIAKLSRRLS